MGMFDSLYDEDGNEWQTKAFARTLAAYNIGDKMPVPEPDCQVEVYSGRRSADGIATIRDGALFLVPDYRDVNLPLIPFYGNEDDG